MATSRFPRAFGAWWRAYFGCSYRVGFRADVFFGLFGLVIYWLRFWFFAARKNPDTAPLVLWFNGGYVEPNNYKIERKNNASFENVLTCLFSPGSSSMIGLFQVRIDSCVPSHLHAMCSGSYQFQEHGPCRITNDSLSVRLNPYSWNKGANMLYIDQPIGAGWSYGDVKVGTSEEAAADLWNFMQIFLKDPRFRKYANRRLGIFGESYGGHYSLFFVLCFMLLQELNI